MDSKGSRALLRWTYDSSEQLGSGPIPVLVQDPCPVGLPEI